MFALFGIILELVIGAIEVAFVIAWNIIKILFGLLSAIVKGIVGLVKRIKEKNKVDIADGYGVISVTSHDK